MHVQSLSSRVLRPLGMLAVVAAVSLGQLACVEKPTMRLHHAEVAGLTKRQVNSILYGLYSKRVFYSKVKPEGRYRKMWLRAYRTPLKQKPEHLPLHAAAWV